MALKAVTTSGSKWAPLPSWIIRLVWAAALARDAFSAAELLTLRAVRLLGQTDVIVYDHLVSPAILDFVAPDAERIYAGKRRNEHTMRQEQINLLLVKLRFRRAFGFRNFENYRLRVRVLCA